ncbi:hypothetical protein H2201_008261 [Coniosporium apollinis]|uniref:Uncharacterized protein n=1 Tax=Coniosporium apollinis TaxID=61459 RepID=A0ABQ9NK61_9PEZI|nr:hypothetical protein H2201_008261 [Coniosporium apollinis]
MIELPITALLFLLAASVGATPPGFWDIEIDNGPAPSPEDGPPLSANASRDKSLLPAQICGILGGYIITILFIGACLLIFGRRLRKQALLAAQGAIEVEMVKPTGKGFDPISPASTARTWLPSPSKLKHTFRKSATSLTDNPKSPGGISVASFDSRVIESDKEKRQQEMERLYAAVAAHDSAQSKVVYSAETEEIRPASGGSSPPSGTSPPKKPGRRLPQLQTALNAAHLDVPGSPASPRSPIRTIYPPDYPMAVRPQQSSVTQPSSPRSILTRKDRTPSMGSASSKTRRGLRNLRISAPLDRYPADDDDEAKTPLSPRFYNPGPPPSPPNASAPTTPGTVDGLDDHYEGLDKPQPLPRPAPQRSNSRHSSTAVPTLSTISVAQSASPSTSTLPLRALGDAALPATKTTYLERRRDALGLTTPRTGVPATPYSPYMPFTPITPVTPHLVSRHERKMMKKNEVKKVATADDQVKDEKELWDSGY